MKSIYPSLELIWVCGLLVTHRKQWKWCRLTSKERLEKVPQLPPTGGTFSFGVVRSPTVTWLPCSEKAKHIKRPHEHWSTAQLRSQANQQHLLPDMWLPNAPLDDVSLQPYGHPTPPLALSFVSETKDIVVQPSHPTMPSQFRMQRICEQHSKKHNTWEGLIMRQKLTEIRLKMGSTILMYAFRVSFLCFDCMNGCT